MRHFEHLSSGLDVKPLTEALARQPELWSEVTGRQEYPGSAHRQTKAIFLRWCKGLDIKSAFTEIPAFNFPAIGKLPEAHELINKTIHRVGALELGRVLIVSLQPGGVITPHADEGAYADHYERFHIALYSKDCVFHCGGEMAEMKEGELWWFNHKLEHTVINISHEPRLHLIIDCVSPMFRESRLPKGVPLAV